MLVPFQQALTQMDDEKPLCSTCVYFDSDTDQCRHNAPRVVSANDDHGVWPSVNSDDWCGEWCGHLSAR